MGAQEVHIGQKHIGRVVFCDGHNGVCKGFPVVLTPNVAKVEFKDVSENLSVKVTPNPIPARGTAELEFTVKASRDKWGRNDYWAVPVIDGKIHTASNGDKRLGFWAFTKEDFSKVTADDKRNGPRPTFKESTYSFGKIRKGQKVTAEYTFKNDGKECFCIYKVNADAKRWSHSTIPAAMPGEEVTFRVHLETDNLPVGEHLTIVTLTTNSPLRPIVNLFIAGYIE